MSGAHHVHLQPGSLLPFSALPRPSGVRTNWNIDYEVTRHRTSLARLTERKKKRKLALS